jgi:hypothetical protein
MADEAPNPEEMVPSFLHALMWACIFGAVDAIITAKPWPVWASAFGLSLISHVVGIKWPQIKPKIGPRFASTIERVARNRRYRWVIYSVIVIASLASIGFRAYRHYYPSLVQSLSPVQAKIESGVQSEQMLAPNSKAPQRPVKQVRTEAACKIEAKVRTELVARLYMRGPLPQAPQTEAQYEPTIQELFFDWTLTVAPNMNAGEVGVVLKDSQKPTYRLSVKPESAVVSDVAPTWMSGFSEPRVPDYYKRVITFRQLEKTAVITTRRPVKVALGKNELDAATFPVSDVEVNPGSHCEVELPENEDSQKRFLRLMIQFSTFANWKHGKDKKPLKIRLDPDEPMPPLQPGEAESTIELRCQDPDCKHLSAGKLEARRIPSVAQVAFPPLSSLSGNLTGSPSVVTPPVTKTQDQVQSTGAPPHIIPEDPVKAVEAVDRMRHSLTEVLGKKDTITFLMSWPDDDNSNLVLISGLLSEACRVTPRQCWFTQPRSDGRDLDRPPIHGSGRNGITVHGPDARALAAALGAWFSTYSTSIVPTELNGYNEYHTKEMMWIEIGPGSPWKPTTK